MFCTVNVLKPAWFFHLRFKHMQVRVDAESIAFQVSGAVESFKTNNSLDKLVSAQQNLFDMQVNTYFTLTICILT